MLSSTDALEVVLSSEFVEGGQESLGAFNIEAVENKRKFGNILDVMATGEHEGCNGGGGESGCDGVALLVGVHLAVPLSPGPEGSEHSALTAHVTECSLSRAVGSGS